VRTEDLIDAHEVARLLGLAQPNSVSLYQRRYPDMPRPVIDLGANRPHLWLRRAIEAWTSERRSINPTAAPLPAGSGGNVPPARRGRRQEGGCQVAARLDQRHTALTGGAAALDIRFAPVSVAIRTTARLAAVGSSWR